MATATQVLLSPSLTLTNCPADGDASHLASMCRKYLNALNADLPDLDHARAYTPAEILALPLSQHRIPDELHGLPRRRSARNELAASVAALLSPCEEGSLTALIRYETDRVRLRGWAALQRKYDRLLATQRHGKAVLGLEGAEYGVQAPVWSSRIMAQGPWDATKRPVSLKVPPAIPMPVQVSPAEDLAPFLGHLSKGGTHMIQDNVDGKTLDEGKGEPYYGVQGAEFQRGVLYEDGRMDLCKMVVGPDHIWRLMDSLRENTFVRHFLLGNNIVGPSGARAIANFIRELPDRMDTWYLAGNCIDGAGFKDLVDAMVGSPAVTNIWLKRNPLGPGAADDLYRLITGVKNLRTLDLDQTELGDEGAARLFSLLASHKGNEGEETLPLRNLYLNGNGMSTKAAEALSRFLVSPHCGVTSVYLSCNPLGDEGCQALASVLPQAPHLARLLLQSVGASTQGAVALCEALAGHPSLRTLDLGQAYATEDLSQAYNYVEDDAVPSLVRLIEVTPTLECLGLGHCPISPPELLTLASSVCRSRSLLYYTAASTLPDPTFRPTFVPGTSTTLREPGQRSPAQLDAEKAVRARLEANVRAKHGDEATYAWFMAEEKRWLVSDGDVRKIDSVYRNRDAGLARRGVLELVKQWDEGDDTLERVKGAQGPVCALRR